MRSPRPFTLKQTKFIQEYLKDGNGSAAAVRAGYAHKWADRFAHSLVENHRGIREAIQKEQDKLRAVLHLSATRIVEELSAIGMSNIGNVLKQGPNGEIAVRDLNTLPPHVQAAISHFKCETTKKGRVTETHIKIQFHNKISALEQLCKILGVTPERIQKEMAAPSSENQNATFDPRDLPDEEWQMFVKINQWRLAQLGN